jgi:hypothetical protein
MWAEAEAGSLEERVRAAVDQGRPIPAEVIAELCTHQDAVDPRVGVTLEGAQIIGQLDLAWSHVRVPLHFKGCRLEGGLNLYAARVRSVIVESCDVRSVEGSQLECEHDVMFLESELERVALEGARVSGRVSLRGSTLGKKDGQAFLGDHLSAGVVDFGGAKVTGELRIAGAQIGALTLAGATLTNPEGNAFVGDSLSTAGDTYFDNTIVVGELRLAGAQIGGALSMARSRLTNTTRNAFVGDRLSTAGDAYFGKTTVVGELRLAGATIRGELSLAGATLSNPEGNALVGDGLSTSGHVYFDDTTVEGEVRLAGATIGRRLSMAGATLSNPGGNAFVGDGLSTTGDVRFPDAAVQGELRLAGAKVGGELSMAGATLSNPGGNAFVGDGLSTTGNVRFVDATVQGELRLVRARVAATLFFEACHVTDGDVNLSATSVGVVDNCPGSWPERLNLDGFSYGLTSANDNDVESRLSWIRRSHAAGQRHYSPGVYDQLAEAYRRAGQDRNARKVAIAREEDRRSRGQLNRLSRWWNKFLSVTVGHGYKPWRIAIILVIVVLLATAFFWLSPANRAMAPAMNDAPDATSSQNCTGNYECFSAPIYSLDVLLPVVDLRQESNWRPTPGGPWGWPARVATWILIVIGWLLTTALLAAVSKLWRD